MTKVFELLDDTYLVCYRFDSIEDAEALRSWWDTEGLQAFTDWAD